MVKHQVLWTGGWDSTYRVAELTLEEAQVVQPWYVRDPSRRSTSIEVSTIFTLREKINSRASMERVLEPIIIDRDEIPRDDEVSSWFEELRARSHLGSQYDWLARLAKSRAIRLELSVRREDKAHDFLRDYVAKGTGETYRLSVVEGPLSVFSGFDLPLFETSKMEMQDRSVKAGYSDIMEETWFCHTPLFGKPCGLCNPCKYTREEGLSRRVPSPGLFRKIIYRVGRFGSR